MAGQQLNFFGQQEEKDESGGRKIISIPLDTLLLSAIALILLLVLFFSLGVERGKKNALQNIKQVPDIEIVKNDPGVTQAIPVLDPLEPVITRQVPSRIVERAAQSAEPIKGNDKALSVANNAFASGKYSVQIASFQKQAAAYEEAKKLEAKGLRVSVMTRGKYSVVCVGAFDELSEAKKQQDSLKKIYKDCFVRRL